VAAAPKRLRQADWTRSLLHKIKEDGSVSRSLRSEKGGGVANVVTILTHDERWTDTIAYDQFGEGVVTLKVPPWRACDMPASPEVGDWTDSNTARLQSWLADVYALDVSESIALQAIRLVADKRLMHPVRQWLETLQWDAQRRLPTWLSDVMGCEDNAYTRAVGTAWAVSAVARAYQPGCKVDTVLVLEGPPGIFKSSVLRAIAGDEWFLEVGASDVNNKDALQVLRRKWIAEFPEIDQLSHVEQGHVKSFFSRQVDTYRPSYGRGARDFKRQTVFAATTNKSDWITDETGGTGRRMWPVKCRWGDIGLAKSIRDQIWAEARARYDSGEKWHIVDPEIREAELTEQDDRFRIDPWEPVIAHWLVAPVSIGKRSESGVTTADVMGINGALGIETGKMSRVDSMRVGAILRKLGWEPGGKETRGLTRVRLYRPTATPTATGYDPPPMLRETVDERLDAEFDAFPTERLAE
jgi:putative DNA primase/helicase